MNQNVTTKQTLLLILLPKQNQRFFVNKLKHTYPSHYLLGEEGTASHQEFNPKDETVWIIDPIDGTTNFVHQGRNFCISLAVYEKGEPLIGMIYDPIADELFHAKIGEGAYLNERQLPKLTSTTLEEAVISINQLWIAPNEKINHQNLHELVQKVRATRYLGSAALEMAYVACGRLEAYIDFRSSPWDMAGGLVLLAEVGEKRQL